MSSGKVVQVIGPVVDVEFPLNESLPEIDNALHVKREDGSDLVLEVALELGTELCGRLPWIQLMG